jgi:hypothetical protein
VVRTADAPETMFPDGFDHRTTDTLMDSLSVDAAEAAASRLWRRVMGSRPAPDRDPVLSRV